jgi:hypothetical protein
MLLCHFSSVVPALAICTATITTATTNAPLAQFSAQGIVCLLTVWEMATSEVHKVNVYQAVVTTATSMAEAVPATQGSS